MDREAFKEMLTDVVSNWELSVSTEVEYGYGCGDTAYVKVELKTADGLVILSDFGVINLPRDS